jgi:hypothetical protein
VKVAEIIRISASKEEVTKGLLDFESDNERFDRYRFL